MCSAKAHRNIHIFIESVKVDMNVTLFLNPLHSWLSTTSINHKSEIITRSLKITNPWSGLFALHSMTVI